MRIRLTALSNFACEILCPCSVCSKRKRSVTWNYREFVSGTKRRSASIDPPSARVREDEGTRKQAGSPFFKHPPRNPQKHSLPACFFYVSIHTTCQPIVNHYCTFFRVMIFFLLYFFNYFTFSSLILDVPCLYRQPTAKKTTSSPSSISLPSLSFAQ